MAMIFTRPVQLGDSVLEGQVVLLDIDTMQYSAPNKRRSLHRASTVRTFAPSRTRSSTSSPCCPRGQSTSRR
jgi:hypothetical protein